MKMIGHDDELVKQKSPLAPIRHSVSMKQARHPLALE
jgi:hypothetical protein